MARSVGLRGLITTAALAAVTFWLGASGALGQALEPVKFATNWLAEPEQGGFYQAVADGTYQRYGLNVTIVPGGPDVNNRILLPVGKIDFFLSANLLQAFDAAAEQIPTVSVAALFQKDPQVLIAHPDQGIASFEDLKKLTLLISKEGVATYFQWMKAEFGFRDDQVKPYTFNPQPFLANPRVAMQGYVTSEPYAIEKLGGFKPKIFLLADQGFNTYSTLIETRRELIERKPDLVRRFVEASIIGWYHFLYGDSTAACLDQERQSGDDRRADRLLDRQAQKLRHRHSGEASTLGIGAMTDERVESFFNKMVKAGVTKPGVDFRRAYSLQFVNHGVGLEARPKR